MMRRAHQNVDAAKLVDGGLHCRLAAGLHGQVAGQQQHLPASLLHHTLGFLEHDSEDGK